MAGGWPANPRSIGRTSGDERYLFGDVVGAVMLRDGRIAVADRQAYLIRVYSPEGVHIEDWGGRGEGPGEFGGGLRKLFPYRGDSILVKQFASYGSNVYDDRGRFGRAIAPEMWLLFMYDRPSLGFDPAASSAGTCCTLWGPLTNGALLGSYSDMVSMAGGGTRRGSVMAAIVFGADGRYLGVIELPAGLEVYQIGRDFLLGKLSDEIGVDRVHLYRIEK